MAPTTSKDQVETTIRVVLFNGNKSDWMMWDEKFLARARRRGYKDILLGRAKESVPTDEEYEFLNEDEEGDMSKIKLRQLNELAYDDLILSMDTTTASGKVAFNLVRAAKSKDYQDGNAMAAYKRLKSKYAPETGPTLTKLHKAFYSSKLKRNSDPDVFITELEDIRVRMEEMSSSMTDEQFMVYVVNNLTKDYEVSVDLMGRRIGASKNPLTVEELREELNLRYERIGSNKNDDDDEEHALYAGNKYKGKCNHCGKQGHKSDSCWEKDPSKRPANRNGRSSGRNNSNKGTTRFAGKCNYCQIPGHKEIDCRKKQRDEQASTATDSTKSSSKSSKSEKAELVFMAWEVDNAEDQPTGDRPGQYANCFGYGPVGQYCDACEDSGMVFEPLNAAAVQDIAAELTQPPLTVSERIARQFRSLPDNDELSLFFATVAHYLHIRGTDQMDYVETRLGVTTCMGINTVKQLVRNIYDVNSWLTVNAGTDSDYPITTQEKKLYLELGSEWLEQSGRYLEQTQRPSVSSSIPPIGDTFSELPLESLVEPSVNPDDTFRETPFMEMLLSYLSEDTAHTHDAVPDTAHATAPDTANVAYPQKPPSIVQFSFPPTQKHDSAHISQDTDPVSDKHMWLADSGASCYMTCSLSGMFNLRDLSSSIKIGNGKALKALKIGSKRLKVIQKDGTIFTVVINDCKYIPDLWVNLFSVTQALKNGYNISNKGLIISLKKGDARLTFDQVLETHSGQVVGVNMVPHSDAQSDVAHVLLEHGRDVDVNVLHKTLGHIHEDALKKTASYYGMKLTGTFERCYECSLAKSKQKATAKFTDVKSTIPGERLFLDISSCKAITYSGSKYWLLVVDDATDKCWSAFLTSKGKLPERIIKLLKNINLEYKYVVKFIRLDDAGENKSLQKQADALNLGIKFEFTGPGTPQYNGRSERKFAVLYARVRAMLNTARVPQNIREGIWAEAAQYATDIENIIVSANKPISSDNQFYKTTGSTIKSLRVFGEVAVVEDSKTRKIHGKLVNRGKPCLFLGRAPNHSSDTFRFLSLETNKVILSRNVTWLRKNYSEWKGLTDVSITRLSAMMRMMMNQFLWNKEGLLKSKTNL